MGRRKKVDGYHVLLSKKKLQTLVSPEVYSDLVASEKPFEFSRDDIAYVEKRLNQRGLVALRLTKSKSGFEVIGEEYVTIKPRFHFEKVHVKGKRGRPRKHGDQTVPRPVIENNGTEHNTADAN